MSLAIQRFRFSSNGKEYIWREVNEPPSMRTIKPTVKKGGGNIMVWGCMAAQGVGYATRINGTMDSKLYLEVLRDEMTRSIDWCFDKKDKDEWVFQQDNSSCHKSQSVYEIYSWQKNQIIRPSTTITWFKSNRQICGTIVKSQIHKNHTINGVEDIWKAFEEEWNKITPDFCENLIRSMPERIQAVIESKGGPTKY